MVHMTRYLIYKGYKGYKQYVIDHLTLNQSNSSIVLLYYCSPLLLSILMHCRKKTEKTNKACSNYRYMLITPVSQVR